jgi:hypothetical protein
LQATDTQHKNYLRVSFHSDPKRQSDFALTMPRLPEI